MLILIEGLDRTGKSSVASYFQSKGFELIHLSAPSKKYTQDGYTGPSYLDDMIELISSAVAKDIVLDRSHYGELVWPEIYNRKSLLSDDDIEAIREMEESVGVKRIMMHDPNVEGHWKRCVDNKEPLNKAQFVKARALYSNLAHKYGFETITLTQFLTEYPDAGEFVNLNTVAVTVQNNVTTEVDVKTVNDTTTAKYPRGKTSEQIKLEKANAINSVLSKRILKSKGPMYDELENDLRIFLNDKLGKLFGTGLPSVSLNEEEIKFYKTMYKRALKENDV